LHWTALVSEQRRTQPRPAPPDPMSLVLGCHHCGVKLRLDLFDGDPDAIFLTENVWPCRHWGKENRAGLLGTVALVSKESELQW